MADKSFPEAMREWGLEANKHRAKRDDLDRRIKYEQAAHDDALALHLAQVMSPEMYKKWSSSSTPASARIAIEQATLQETPFKWMIDINQLKIDMAAEEKAYRDARTQYEFYAYMSWRDVLERLPEPTYGPPAGIAEQLPHAMPSAVASVPPPHIAGDKAPWED